VIRAILCRIGAKPHTIYLGRDDDHAAVVGWNYVIRPRTNEC